MSVIAWTLGAGTVVFALGLISAFESRRKRTIKLAEDMWFGMTDIPVENVKYVRVSMNAPKNTETKTAMSMAASGTGNVSGSAVSAISVRAEENLASVVSHPS